MTLVEGTPPKESSPPKEGIPPVPVQIWEPWYVREVFTRLWDGLVVLISYWLALTWVEPDQVSAQLWLAGLAVVVFYLLSVTLILSPREVGKTSRFSDFPTMPRRHFPG